MKSIKEWNQSFYSKAYMYLYFLCIIISKNGTTYHITTLLLSTSMLLLFLRKVKEKKSALICVNKRVIWKYKLIKST